MERGDVLRVGTGWIEIEVVSEVDVALTFRGYAPFLRVRVLKSGLEKTLYVGAKSLATGLQELREKNAGNFSGLHLRIRKESDEQVAPYVIEAIPL